MRAKLNKQTLMLKSCTLTSSKARFVQGLFIYAVCEQLVVRKFILCGAKGIRPNDLPRQDEGGGSLPSDSSRVDGFNLLVPNASTHLAESH